jgi:hypothetical protein
VGWTETLIILAAALAAFAWANRVARRPVDLARPRLVPLVPVMAVALVAAILMLAHLITLATGQPFTGGSRF